MAITHHPTKPVTVRVTQRKLEVLRLVYTGLRSQQIADRLCVAKRTIDFHLRRIFEKFHVNNRVQAVRAAMYLGLLPFEGRGPGPAVMTDVAA